MVDMSNCQHFSLHEVHASLRVPFSALLRLLRCWLIAFVDLIVDAVSARTLSAAEGWETVEPDNGVVAAGAASDFESSWDEPEALMGGAAAQSSSAGPAASGSKGRPSRDRHGWRL